MAKIENYNGSVSLMAGITQKGGGDFAMVEANAVQTREDGTRLDAELEALQSGINEKANIEHTHDDLYYTEPEIDIKVEELQLSISTKAATSALSAHISNIENPHAVTKSQIGLSNVNNTSDANKPISLATQAELDTKQNILAFDTVPIENSKNPVTSMGIKAALDALNFIDYETYIAFDTSWIASGIISESTSVLGKAMLGKAILGTY